MDIATLGFSIDASGLDKATRSLINMSKASTGAAAAERSHATASGLVAKSTALAATSTATAAAATSRLNTVLASNSTRQFGMQMSQMAQQTMAGGDAIRALAIQLPDIGLAFGAVGIAAGVLGGILVPMIANLAGAGDSAKAMEDKLTAVSEALAVQADAADMASMSTEELRTRYGAFADTMQSTLTLLSNVATAEATRQIDGLSQSLAELLGTAGATDSRASLADFFDVNIALAFTDAARSARAEARGMTAEFQAAQASLSSANGDIDKQIAATQQMLAVASKLASSRDGVSDTEAELIAQLSDTLALMLDHKAAAVAIADGMNGTSAAAKELLADLNAQADVQATIAVYGKDSARVAALRADQEREAFEATLDSLNASEDMKNELRLAFVITQDLTAAAAATTANLSGAAGEASRLAQNLSAAASALSSVMNATANLDLGTIGIEAQNKALEAGNSLIQARATALIATKKAELSVVNEFGDANDRRQAATELENYTDAVNRNSSAQEINKGILDARSEADRAASKAATAGAKASKSAASEAAKAAKEAQKAYEDQLEAAQKLTEKYYTPVEKYGDAIAELDDIMGQGHISAETYARAMADINDELVNSYPLVSSLKDAFYELGTDSLNSLDDLFDRGMDMVRQFLLDAAWQFAQSKWVMPAIGLTGSGVGAAGGIMSGAGGMLGGIGSGLFGGASSVLSGLMSGGLSGGLGAISTSLAGATSGLAGLATAAGAVALPLAAAYGAFKFFTGSTKELDAGIRLNIQGNELLAESYKKVQKSRFFGLSKKTRTSTGDIDDSGLSDAYSAIYQGAVATAEALNISTGALAGYSQQISISTKGMSDAEAQTAVMAELQKASDALSDRTLAELERGFTRFSDAGETAAETLTRLTTSLTAANYAADVMGVSQFASGRDGLKSSVDLAEGAGGAQQLVQLADMYFNGVLSQQEQLKVVNDQLNAALRGVTADPSTIEGFKASYEKLIDAGSAAAAGALLASLPIFLQREKLEADLAALGGTMDDAAEAARELAAAEAARANERMGLERALYQVQGRTDMLREMELQALDPANRALQSYIYKLQDAQTAASEAAAAEAERQQIATAAANERAGLERELYQLQGRTDLLRKMEVDALSPANRALQNLIFSLQDTQSAAESAAEAETERQRQREAVADERATLQREIYQLQGRTDILRNMELAALDPANRAMQKLVYSIQDMQSAAERAAEAEADRLQQAEAVASERSGLQEQIWQLTGREDLLLARERAALDVSNRGLFDRIQALQEEAEITDLRNTAIQNTMDLFRSPLSLDSNQFGNRFDATISAAQDRRDQIAKEANDAQLTEQKLTRQAIAKLADEVRDIRLNGVKA